MITIHEKFESRLVTTGQDPSAELRYSVQGTNDDYSARVTVEAGSPVVFDVYHNGTLLLWRESISVEPVGDELWEAVVRYTRVPPTEESSFSFETGGGTEHVTQSKETVGVYPLGFAGTGAIGQTRDGVEGTDIVVPVYQFSETHYLPDSAVTPAYKAALFALTGKVNTGAFKGFAVGECLFLGASGSKRSGGDWEITYRFAASPNMTDLVIHRPPPHGDITGISKGGWDYLWIRYKDIEGPGGVIVKLPQVVYVERVYDSGNFAQLGIGT